jgi:hypothetical protein
MSTNFRPRYVEAACPDGVKVDYRVMETGTPDPGNFLSISAHGNLEAVARKSPCIGIVKDREVAYHFQLGAISFQGTKKVDQRITMFKGY